MSSPDPATAPAAPVEMTASAQSKADGNDAYLAKDYETAIKFYTQAIEQAEEGAPAIHLLYANLAAAHLACGKFDKAISNCDACLSLVPGFAKAHVRKANALLKQGKFELAMAAVTTGVSNSKGEASADFKRLQTAIRRAMGPSADQKERMNISQAAMTAGGRGGGGGTREEITELQVRFETAQLSCAKLRQEIKNKEYDVRRNQMALTALGQETKDADTATFQQVGRMFMERDLDSIVEDINTTTTKANSDLERLKKNLEHMERQVKEVRGEIQEIMPRTQG